MSTTNIWWEDDDQETTSLVELLGGQLAVERAVQEVLPNRQVKVRALTPGVSGAVVFLASPQSSHDGRRVSEVDGVLKVGQAQLLADEVQRYGMWVAPLLSHPSHFPPLGAPYGLEQASLDHPEHLRALHYRHVGHTTLGERLRSLLRTGDVQRANALLDALFHVLRPWQETAEPIGTKALTADGVYSFGGNPFKEFEQTCAKLNAGISEEGDLIPAGFGRVRDIWGRNALGSERFLQSIVHGDLHIDNVIVGPDDTLTLIDFGATGEGHFLRDISTLEAHLVLRAMSPSADTVDDVQRAYLAELGPLYSRGSDFLSPIPAQSTPLQAIVSRLRRYAFYSLMRANADYVPQYFLGVLRHAIRVCTRNETFSDAQRWLAARVATAIRDSLKLDKRRLLVADWPPVSPGTAYAFLDDAGQRKAGPDGLDLAFTGPCGPASWDIFARVVLTAKRVDFVGTVPVQLASAILHALDAPDVPKASQPRLRYLTRPHRPGAQIGSPPVPMWEKAALSGMRNIVNRMSNTRVSLDGFAYAADGVTSNCLIRCVRADSRASLHLAARVSEPEVLDNPYVLLELQDPDDDISDWVTAAFARSEPVLIREVDCCADTVSTADETSESFRAPQVLRLSPYGATLQRSPCLRPIALTILRTAGPIGKQVVLKLRSPLTDNDDFGKLSFLSARILAEDISSAAGIQLPAAENAEDALSQLWENIGEPMPFVLGEDVFVHAARRDVFATTILDLPPERFSFKGMHVLSRQRPAIQLGFAVLTVDLDQVEVSAARQANKVMRGAAGDLLQVVPIEELFTGQHPVNRFMQNRQAWLQQHCL